MKDTHKDNSDKNNNEWFVIMPKEHRLDTNIEQEKAERSKKTEKIVERELSVIAIFIIIFTLALFMTFNVYFSILAICGYPLYLIVRFIVWKHKN
ncbi:MAG: hypothetical protein ABIA97_04465 [Candidatus Omnitrophota bacterium]